jgi:hypothetical protein
LIEDNQILKLEHPAAAIRIGVGGNYFVAHATIRKNLVLETYAASLYIAECLDAEVTGNRFLNPNSVNGFQGHTEPVYVDGVAWGGSVPPKGKFNGNEVTNQSPMGSRGYARYGVSVENPTNSVIESGNLFTGMIAGLTFQVKASQ